MFRRLAIGLFVVSAVAAVKGPFAHAQEKTAASPAAATTPEPKKLAPGVLTTIDTEREDAETFSGPRPVVEIIEGVPKNVLDWTPNYYPQTDLLKNTADKAIFRRTVWHLEFTFKPLRMIDVDIPQPSGRMLKKRIWYMVYKVRNNGYHLSAVPGKPDKLGRVAFDVGPPPREPVIRFFPKATLEAHDYDLKYLDEVIPLAVPLIQQREDPAIPLNNSVRISQAPIPVSDERIDRSVWGVFTWVDVDPKIDFFSIYIQGLTNAYRWVDPPGAYRMGDPPGTGRRYARKTLQLNFWHAGDELDPREEELRYGLPSLTAEMKPQDVLKLYGLEKRVDHQWIYR